MKETSRANRLLRQARLERGWSQRRLAEELDIVTQTVGSWERGARIPSLEMRARLCSIFGKTPEQLGLPPLIEDDLISQQSTSLTPTVLPEDQKHFSSLEIGDADDEQKAHRWLIYYKGDENRQRMLKRVRTTWINGVLIHSLRGAPLLTPGLQAQPDAVVNPWRHEVQETNIPPHVFPAGTSILQIYDYANGELLILGEPGAGKTTLLLDLTRDLLDRAEQNASYPIPVIFNLPSWSMKRQPLAKWMVEELSKKYWVPRRVGQEWIETDQILPMLDGLDEVAEDARSACIEAINIYQKEREHPSLVVCCRRAEYFAQPTRIKLQQAVLIQPLTVQQVDEYLAGGDGQFEVARKIVDEDPILQEMVKVPLILSIVALTYQGDTDATFAAADSIEARRRRVLATYVERMLERRGVETRYTSEQTVRWLAWLARQMEDHNQTEFYIERMQPDWLPDERERLRHRNMMVRLIYSLESIVVAALFAWLRGGRLGEVSGVGAGLLGWLGSGPGNTILGWMAPGLGGGLEGGGMFGLIFCVVSVLVTILIDASSTQTVPAKTRLSWARIRRIVSNGLFSGLIGGTITGVLSGLLFFGASGSLNYALPRVGGIGLFGGLIVGLLSVLVTGLSVEPDRKTSSVLTKTWRIGFMSRLVDGLIIGLCSGLSFGIVNGFLVGAQQGSIYGSISGLAFGAAFGFGGGTRLIRDLGREIKPAETVGWDWQHVRQNLLSAVGKSLRVALFVTVIIVTIIGTASSLFYGPAYGLAHGLVYGPIVGLVVGVASILTSVLNSGWSSNMLDERQLLRPNEGIRRSLRNSLFAGCLFGPIGGLASGTIVGIAFGLIGGLSGWFILGIGFTIVCGIIFALLFAVLRGGIAYIEHYMLRWRLWRTGHLPLNTIRFLDYTVKRILLRKVGGGYMFVHSLLLEYFATLDIKDTPEKHS